jgi:hypothetical protein
MGRVEETIRKYLATHLTFLSQDLYLIQEEYPLPNELGTRGSIDILARDDDNRYVIIEVKRTNQASRQAIHEINKYAALIKQRFHVKESEIRIIIVSSEWDELRVPYSEWYHHTDYWVEGYYITLDQYNLPIDKMLIIPEEETLKRNISPFQLCFLSSQEETMKDMVKTIKDAMTRFSLPDFIVVTLSREQIIPYPFCAYLAFQRYSKQFYLNLLKSLSQTLPSLENYETEDDSEEQFVLYLLEDEILALVVEQVKPESLETSEPDKFNYLMQKWQIKDIVRSGFFKIDNRLTDEMLIAELRGHRGGSNIFYVDSSDSQHKSKMKEIKENVVHCLAFNPPWKQHILAAFSDAKKQKCKIDIAIYCPSQILSSLTYLSRGEYEYHLPTYLLILAFSDETHIYEGKIKWNGSVPLLDDILKSFFPHDSFEYFLHMSLGTIGDFDDKIMKKLGLDYFSNRIVIHSDTTEQYELFSIIDNGMQCSPPIQILTIKDFIKSSNAFLAELCDFYSQHIHEISL